MGKKVEPAGNGAESGGGDGGTLLRPPCRSYSRASCHARIGRAAGSLSLRLGQNPIPLRGLWAFAPASVQAPLRGYPRASCHARIGRAAGSLSLRLGQNPIPLRGLWAFAPASVQAPLRGYPRASIPAAWSARPRSARGLAPCSRRSPAPCPGRPPAGPPPGG